MSEVVLSELDRCLGKRGGLQLHLGPSPPSPPSPKRPCTMAACARVANPGLVRDASPPTADPDDGHTSATTASTSNSSEWDDATSWDTNLVPDMALGRTRPLDKDDARGQTIEESCKRALDHFPCPTIAFPTPTLEFDFRVAVTLKPESSQVQGRAHKEITAISSGNWSGSFGHGKVMAGGYDLGQARGFRPIRIVEGAFIMQTTDEAPATLEMRTRGSLSGPCDILDDLLSLRNPKRIDPRKYGFRMFLTIKTADKRYAEIVNCGLWVASGVWKDDELIIDAYRVT